MVEYVYDSWGKHFMDIILKGVIIPIVIYLLSRVFNGQGNYYLTVKEDVVKKRKFYKMGKFRYVLVSIFCHEDYVAKCIIVMSILCLINSLLISVSALILYYTNISVFFIIFSLSGVILIIISGCFANFRDKTVWTDWGGRKKK